MAQAISESAAALSKVGFIELLRWVKRRPARAPGHATTTQSEDVLLIRPKAVVFGRRPDRGLCGLSQEGVWVRRAGASSYRYNSRKYPERGGHAKELKVRIPEWVEAGLPFTLMLYQYQNSAVRILVSRDAYDDAKESLRAFAQNSDRIGEYPLVYKWPYWRSVLADDGNQEEPANTLCDAEIFEDDYWEKVRQKLETQMNILLPIIRNWLDRTRYS